MQTRDTHALGFGIVVAVTGLLSAAYLSTSAAAQNKLPSSQGTDQSAGSISSAGPSSVNDKSLEAQKAATASGKLHVSEQVYGVWTLQCMTGVTAKPSCQVIHRLTSADGQQIALVLSMAMVAKDTVALQMALPLGFSIQKGVKITLGSNYSTLANVTRCTNQGCLLEGNAPPDMIAAMLRSKEGSVSVQTMLGEEIKLAVSFNGFSTAYNAMMAKGDAG